MGNRDNNGRFASTTLGQQIRQQVGDNCAVNQQASAPASESTQIELAQKNLAEVSEHAKLASDAKIQLDAQMPFFGHAIEQQSEALFKWFRHQGFWPVGWEPHGNYFDSDGPEDSPAAEYRRLKKAEKIALIHSELSECLEAVRNNDSHNEAEELADTLVRLLDYAGGFGIELGDAFYRKMLANYHRPHRHGKKF